MEKELEIYYDHYKDTFNWIRHYIKLRDKYFVYLVILSVILLYSSWMGDNFYNIANEIIQHNLKIKPIDFNTIDTILLFVILVIVIKYIQINMTIERQYDYLHKLEENLSNKMNNFKIIRESKGYLNNYPIVLNIIHYLYTLIFPMVLILLIAYKIYIMLQNNISKYQLYFDIFLSLTILSLIIFHLVWYFFKR